MKDFQMFKYLRLIVVLLCFMPCRVCKAYGDEVTLLVAPFEGPEGLSQSVTTILGLQIWQTLRRAPDPNPTELDFGLGTVKWKTVPLRESQHTFAEISAKEPSNLAQLVLWGKVYEYGQEGAVVQAHLTIPRYGERKDKKGYNDFRKLHPEIWTINIPLEGDRLTFQLDLPQRRYSFEPIVLKKEFIRSYWLPNGLPIYDSPNRSKVIGSIGLEFLAIEHRGEVTKVVSNGVTGWVYLPALSENRSEITDFVGGILRIFRGDWEGAEVMLQGVVTNPNAPNELKVEASLFQAMVLSKQSKPADGSLAFAEELNPFKRRIVNYKIMSLLSTYSRATDEEARRNIGAELQELIAKSGSKFEENDPWWQDIQSEVKRLAVPR